MNPVWGSILEDIAAMRNFPRYSRKDGDEQKKIHELINRSGIDEGIERVLGYLRYDG